MRHRANQGQLKELEGAFRQNQTLSSEERDHLATSLGLSPKAIQIWFQNRRAKEKRRQRVLAFNRHVFTQKVRSSSTSPVLHLPPPVHTSMRYGPPTPSDWMSPQRSSTDFQRKWKGTFLGPKDSGPSPCRSAPNTYPRNSLPAVAQLLPPASYTHYPQPCLNDSNTSNYLSPPLLTPVIWKQNNRYWKPQETLDTTPRNIESCHSIHKSLLPPPPHGRKKIPISLLLC